MNVFKTFNTACRRFFSRDSWLTATTEPDDFALYGRNADYVARATGDMTPLVKGILNRAGPDDLANRETMLAFYRREVEKMSPHEMILLARANVVRSHKPSTPSSP